MSESEYKSIHFNNEVIMYVPCYQSLKAGYPCFTYDMSEATSDEQLAWSMGADYVLVLKGIFDAKTQPFSKKIEEYNRGIKNE